MNASPVHMKMLPCPHCRMDSLFYFSFYSRNYYHCRSCDLIFLHQQKKRTDVISYYRERYFDDHNSDQTSGKRTTVYHHVLNVLARHKEPGTLLDVGCGCGYFLKEARKCGWNVAGIDPSERSIDMAKTLVGDAAICGTLDDLPDDRQFDAITLINVLDHMVDWNHQFKRIKKLLRPGGILYLRFPNGAFYTFILQLSRKLSANQFMNDFLVFHEYAVTPRAIRHYLTNMWFTNIEVHNTRLAGDYVDTGKRSVAKFAHHALNVLIWITFKSLELISGGRWVWGPSIRVIAKKSPRGGTP